MNLKDLQVGNKIKWKEQIWRVVGEDKASSTINPHCEKWDFILKNENKGEYQKVLIEELSDAIVISA